MEMRPARLNHLPRDAEPDWNAFVFSTPDVGFYPSHWARDERGYRHYPRGRGEIAVWRLGTPCQAYDLSWRLLGTNAYFDPNRLLAPASAEYVEKDERAKEGRVA